MATSTILSVAGLVLLATGGAAALRTGRRRLALAAFVVAVGFTVNMLRTRVLAGSLPDRVETLALVVFLACMALGTIQFLRIAASDEQSSP